MSHLCPEPPSKSLRGKVAIVTGAGSVGDGIGNGRAASIMLADEGCHVICVDREKSWADKTCEMANSKPGRGKALAVEGDVTSAKDCEAIVESALENFGRLDILINNVGIIGAKGTAVEVDMEEWARGMDINVITRYKNVLIYYSCIIATRDRIFPAVKSLMSCGRSFMLAVST